MKKYLLILIFFYLTGNLPAQNVSDKKNILSLSLEELLEIKINSVSKKFEDLLKTPQIVIVITKEQIERRGYTDLEQLFHDLPGFDISRGNGTQYSQIYQRGYRTNNTEKTLLMIDGVEENDLWSNSVWLSRQYPLTNIERVEIIYGPSATVYGANAFLGVINIVTKTADDIINEHNHFGISSQTAYGTWNTKMTDISLSAKAKDISFILTGRIFNSNEQDLSDYPDWDYDISFYDLDYYKTILPTNNNEVAQAAMNSDKTAYYLSPELKGKHPHYSNQTKDYLIYGKFKIDNFTIGFETFKRDEGYGAWYRDDYELGPEFGGKWVPNNNFFYTKYEKKFSEKFSVTSFSNFKIHQLTGNCEELYFKGYFNHELHLNDIINTETEEFLPKDSIKQAYWEHSWWHTYSQQLRSEMRFVFNVTKRFNLISGAEFRVSHIQGNYLYGYSEEPEETAIPETFEGGNHFFSRDLGFYMQGEYAFNSNLNLVLGGRLDNNKIRLNGGYGTVFNPKASLIYTLSGYIFKLIYSEAFMDAGYWAKYGTTPGRLLTNPNLKPEKVKNYEVSVSKKFNNYFYADISSYDSFYKGAVGTVDTFIIDEKGNTIPTTQHQAIGNFQIQGIQSNLFLNYGNYSAYLNYTFTNPYKITDQRIRIGDIANYHINFGVNALFFEKLNINIRANHVGKRLTGKRTTVSDNPLNQIDPYFLLNGTISYEIYKGISAQIIANNIFDTEYFDPGVRSANGIYYASKMPQNKRNFMLRLNINL